MAQQLVTGMSWAHRAKVAEISMVTRLKAAMADSELATRLVFATGVPGKRLHYIARGVVIPARRETKRILAALEVITAVKYSPGSSL